LREDSIKTRIETYELYDEWLAYHTVLREDSIKTRIETLLLPKEAENPSACFERGFH